MKQQNNLNRLAGLLTIVLMLGGCAAATVIRKQPDFENENRQHLMQTFRPASPSPGESL